MSAGSVDNDAAPGYLRARVLRYWVVLELLHERGPLAVSDLVARLEARGLRVKGRPSKAISDTLRWAVPRGWAHPAGRGKYRGGQLRPQTLAYMRSIVERAIRDGDPLIAESLARRGLADVAVAAFPVGGAELAAEDLA